VPILNRIAAKDLSDGIADLESRREVTLTRPQLKSFEETLGRQSMELGLMSYALDLPADEVRAHFIDAAEHLARALAGRAEPEPEESRNPWEADEFLSVIGAFGTPDALARIGALPPSAVRNPPRPATEAVGRYLMALCPFLAGGALDRPALEEVIAACERGNASRDMRRFLRPAARGLLAAEAGDEDGWNEALAGLAAAQAREAQSGDLQLLPAGLMSLRGVMLARLGLARDLECRAVSDYLPLDLLEEDA
jgi:hypothetical protein